MKLVSYFHSEETRLGALSKSGDLIFDLSRAHRELIRGSRDLTRERHISRPLPTRMIEFLERGAEALQTAREALAYVEERMPGAKEEYLRRRTLRPLATTQLLAPVPRPPKLIAAWVNYEEHGKEATVKAPRNVPLFFTKWSTSVIGPGEPIVLPQISRKVDYEAELALVIGAGGRNIPGGKCLRSHRRLYDSERRERTGFFAACPVWVAGAVRHPEIVRYVRSNGAVPRDAR